MSDDKLAAHLISLGATTRSSPLEDSTWQGLGLDPAEIAHVARWLLDHFAGASFANGAAYTSDDDDALGWLLDPAELIEAWEDTRECLPAALLPIENDGADNHLCVHLQTGAVYQHVHDAPSTDHVEFLSDSLEEFLWSLRPTNHTDDVDEEG